MLWSSTGSPEQGSDANIALVHTWSTSAFRWPLAAAGLFQLKALPLMGAIYAKGASPRTDLLADLPVGEPCIDGLLSPGLATKASGATRA